MKLDERPQAWTSISPETSYPRAVGFGIPQGQKGFETPRPHIGGTLDVEGKLLFHKILRPQRYGGFPSATRREGLVQARESRSTDQFDLWCKNLGKDPRKEAKDCDHRRNGTQEGCQVCIRAPRFTYGHTCSGLRSMSFAPPPTNSIEAMQLCSVCMGLSGFTIQWL